MKPAELPPLQIFRSALTTALVLVLLAFLVVLAGFESTWINLVVFGVMAVCWLVTSRSETGLEGPALLFLGVLLLTSLLSVDAFRSLSQVWRIGLLFLAMFFSAGLAGRFISPIRIVGILLIIGGLVMAWSWWDAGQWYAAWLAIEPGKWLPEVSFRLNGSNNLAAYFNMILFPALVGLFRSRKTIIKVALGLYSLSALGLIFLTSSRGGWVGTLAGMVVVVAGLVYYDRRLVTQTWARLKNNRVLLSAVSVAAAGIALAAFTLASRMLNNPTHGAFLDSRSDFWPVAWNMFTSSPLWGKGFNTFTSFQMQKYSYPPFNIFLHAHNQYLDVLSGSGLLGAGAGLWLFVAAIRTFRTRFLAENQPTSWLLLGTGGALAAYLGHGIFDGLYRMPFASYTLMILLGAALARPRRPDSAWVLQPARLALGVLLVSGGIFLNWSLAPLVEGAHAADAGDFRKAAAAFDLAVVRDPFLAISYQQRGLAYANLAQQGEPGALDKAIAAFQVAARLDPTWGLNWANLGALYRAKGELENAAADFSQAAHLAPGAAIYYLNLGIVEEIQGNDEKASQAYGSFLKLLPETYSAYFWRDTAFRKELISSLPTPAPTVNPSEEELNALVLSGNARAVQFTLLANYQVKEGRVAEAERSMEKAWMATIVNNNELLEVTWQDAEVGAATGDLPRAIRSGDQIFLDLTQQGIYGPGSFQKVQYDEQVFGAPAMAQDLASQLIPLPLTDLWGLRLLKVTRWMGVNGQSEPAQKILQYLNRQMPDLDTETGLLK